MALLFYDDTKSTFGASKLRTFHDGQLGGGFESLIYLRNDNPANYYTSVSVSFEAELYNDTGPFGTSGWSVKFIYGERQPTEAEWDSVTAGEVVTIPDIGTTLATDTHTYHPIWVRVYAPGESAAQIRENQRVKVSAFERKVGA